MRGADRIQFFGGDLRGECQHAGRIVLAKVSVVDFAQMARARDEYTASFGAVEKRLGDAITVAKWAYAALWAVLLSACGVVGWLFVHYLPVKIESQVGPIQQRLARIEQAVDDIKEYQLRLFPNLLKDILKKPAKTGVELKEKITLAQSLVTVARNQGIVSDPQKIAEVGQTLRDLETRMPGSAPAVWQTFVQLVGYRSFLGAKLSPAPPIPNATVIRASPGTEFFVLSPEGNLFANLVLEGGSQTLDRGTWVNVIFRGTLIRYQGGPVKLINVHFEDCSFRISLSPPGKKFGEALLASNAPAIYISTGFPGHDLAVTPIIQP